MQKLVPFPAILSLALLAGCGAQAAGDAQEEAAELSDMTINSYKRQCVNVAVLQQVPTEAARPVCDCTIEKLLDSEDLTADAMPEDAALDDALGSCINEFFAELEAEQAVDPAGESE
ncbi:hypothetical protein ACI5KX_03360 [Erythrobacter sp. GH1-10]|uniref:hypothetical protein n=1 Tax=Erythrobacter sp. GH1-10 TaxID=3349334 RepID=UPI0038781C26